MTFTPRCYIAGPMTGYPDYNYPAFHTAAAEMRALGWEVINPAENHGGRTDLPREEYFRLDIPQLISCDLVLFLSGWQKSKGAKLEYKVAKACGIRLASIIDSPAEKLEGGFFRALNGTEDFMPPITSWPREEREKQQGQNFVEFCQGAVDVTPLTLEQVAAWKYQVEKTAQPASFTGRFNTIQPDPFRAILSQMAELHDKKKSDYTGGEHPLANYKNSGESIGVSALKSMFSRLNEKVYRLRVLHKSDSAPQNESVTDSYMDIAILSILSILALDPASGYGEDAA